MVSLPQAVGEPRDAYPPTPARGRGSSTVALRFVVGIAAALAWLVLGAAATVGPAQAAPYEVWSCRDAAGAPVSADAWFVNYEFAPSTAGTSSDACATGGGYRVALQPGQSHTISGIELRFDVPRGTRILDYELWRSATVPTSASFYEAGVDEFADGAVAANVACDSFGLAPCATDAADPLSPANHVTMQSAGPLDLLKVYARCRSGSCQAEPAPPAETTLYRSRVVLDDPTPPTAQVVGGSLAGGTAPATGLSTLQVAAHDGQSGVAAVSMAIDGGPAETIESGNALNGCRLPYTGARPCPSDASPAFLVDSGTLATGEHTAAGTVTDAAGNQTSWGPIAFTVAAPPVEPDPVPLPDPVPVPTPIPLPTPPVTGGIPDNGTPAVAQPRVRLTVARGGGRRAALVRGSVQAADGTPVVGARVALRGQTLGAKGQRDRDLATATTDRNGRFSVARLPAGAYRVTASFTPWSGSPPTVTKRVSTRSTLQLRASATPTRLAVGRRVTLRGRLQGAGPAAQRTLVQVEAIVRGRWRPVGTARATADGRWSWRYRFERVSRPTRFAFRATVPAAPAWPWGSRHSRTMHVRVDP